MSESDDIFTIYKGRGLHQSKHKTNTDKYRQMQTITDKYKEIHTNTIKYTQV